MKSQSNSNHNFHPKEDLYQQRSYEQTNSKATFRAKDQHSYQRSRDKDRNFRNFQNDKYRQDNPKREYKRKSISKERQYRDKYESEIKIHFYIEDVYFPKSIETEKFLDDVYTQLRKAALPRTIQICNKDQQYIKLAVGMKFDKDALGILNGTKTVYLNDKHGHRYLTAPRYSRIFKLYLDNEIQKGRMPARMLNDYRKRDRGERESIHKERRAQRGQRRNSQSSISEDRMINKSRSRSKSRSQENRKRVKKSRSMSRSNSYKKKSYHQQNEQIVQSNNVEEFAIDLVGVPKNIDESIIDDLFSMSSIAVKKKIKNNMEVFEIQLKNYEFYQKFINEEIIIDNIPILVIPKIQQSSLQKILVKHQVILNANNEVNISQIFEYFSNFGDISDILQLSNSSFIISFCNIQDVKKLNLPRNFILKDDDFDIQVSAELSSSGIPIIRKDKEQNYNFIFQNIWNKSKCQICKK